MAVMLVTVTGGVAGAEEGGGVLDLANQLDGPPFAVEVAIVDSGGTEVDSLALADGERKSVELPAGTYGIRVTTAEGAAPLASVASVRVADQWTYVTIRHQQEGDEQVVITVDGPRDEPAVAGSAPRAAIATPRRIDTGGGGASGQRGRPGPILVALAVLAGPAAVMVTRRDHRSPGAAG